MKIILQEDDIRRKTTYGQSVTEFGPAQPQLFMTILRAENILCPAFFHLSNMLILKFENSFVAILTIILIPYITKIVYSTIKIACMQK